MGFVKCLLMWLISCVHFLSLSGEYDHGNWLIKSIGEFISSIRVRTYIRIQNQNIDEQKIMAKAEKSC